MFHIHLRRGGGGASARTGGTVVRTIRKFVDKSVAIKSSTATSPGLKPAANNKPIIYANSDGNSTPIGVTESGIFNNNNIDWISNYGQFPAGPDDDHQPILDEGDQIITDGWVSVNGLDVDKTSSGNESRFCQKLFSGPVPSLEEAQSAIDALKEAFEPAVNNYSVYVNDKVDNDLDNQTTIPTSDLTNSVYSDVSSELEWFQPSLQSISSNLQLDGSESMCYESFRMLCNDEHVQKIVTALATDDEMWKCAQNNEIVREMRKINALDQSKEPAKNFVSWIFDNTKGKALEIFKLLADYFNKFFETQVKTGGTKTSDHFQTIMQVSYMLTVAVFLVVINNRVHIA
ncbi:hypothetical protein ACFE04_027379 [Oxalis oulophora]